MVHADLSPAGAWDEGCLRLAELAAVAVDFPKTGIPAIMPPELKPAKYPSYMEKKNGEVGAACNDYLLEITFLPLRSSQNHWFLLSEEGLTFEFMVQVVICNSSFSSERRIVVYVFHPLTKAQGRAK